MLYNYDLIIASFTYLKNRINILYIFTILSFSSRINKIMARKNWTILIIGLIFFLSFLLRSYHFSDWLYLANDEARDAIEACKIVRGNFSDFPLLGPKLGGTNAQLGPAYYYLLAIPGIIFQNCEPQTFAYVSLFFSLLAIPLLYFTLHQFFNNYISISVTLIFAFSYVFTQYSRFAWNPNTLPFWSLAFALSIYKTFSENNKKKASLYLLLAAFIYGIIGQLHILSLMGFPLIAASFWFFYRPKINWKYWIGSALIVFTLYSPLIIYDVKNNGKNFQAFLTGINKNNVDIQSKNNFLKPYIKISNESGRFFALIISSVNNKELPSVEYISLGLILISFYLASKYCLKIKQNLTKSKKAYICLFLFWFVVYFILYAQLANSLNQVRFWFIVVPPFFFLLAFIFYEIQKIRILGNVMIVSITVILLLLNLSAIEKWYSSMEAKKEVNRPFRIWTSRSFKFDDLITVGEMKNIVKVIDSETIRDDSQSINFNFEQRYAGAFQYIYHIYSSKKYNINYVEKIDNADNKPGAFIYIISSDNSDFRKNQNGVNFEKIYNSGILSLWKNIN